jgi:hypothetical protein
VVGLYIPHSEEYVIANLVGRCGRIVVVGWVGASEGCEGKARQGKARQGKARKGRGEGGRVSRCGFGPPAAPTGVGVRVSRCGCGVPSALALCLVIGVTVIGVTVIGVTVIVREPLESRYK